MRRIEAVYLWPDAVADALSRFEWAFQQPGRYLSGAYESPDVELEHGRGLLEVALRHLPVGARADLGRLVERIEAEFERRTLPDPGFMPNWAAGHWWWRIRER